MARDPARMPGTPTPAGAPGQTRPPVSEAAVRELARRRGDPLVTSVYLDVDGAHRPVADECLTAFDRLAEDVRRRAATVGDPEVPAAVEDDLDRMRRWLQDDLDRTRTRGVGLFSCAAQAFFQAMALPRPVHDQAGLGPAPLVRQLWATLGEYQRFLVALVDRRLLRLVRVDLGEPRELPGAEDPEPRGVDESIELGGFQRHDDDLAEAHFRRAAELTAQAWQRWPADRVVVGGPDRAVAGLESHLPRRVQERIVGRVGVRAAAPIPEVTAAALAVVEAAERRHEADVVEELRQRAAGGYRATTGLEPTLDALTEGRVGTLVVDAEYSAPGARCPACGWMGPDLRVCPRCASPTAEVEDVIDVAIGEALAHHVDVELCRAGDLESLGRIGGLERY